MGDIVNFVSIRNNAARIEKALELLDLVEKNHVPAHYEVRKVNKLAKLTIAKEKLLDFIEKYY